MAQFVPELVNPSDPDSIAEWARLITRLVNGNVSIGEPISTDSKDPTIIDPLRPNGVKGHMLGSFVQVSIGTADLNAPITCTHNLNIPNRATGGLNVGWVIVRIEHSGATANAPSVVSCNYQTTDSASVLANSIALRFYAGGLRTVSDAEPLTITLWFFPATR